MSPSESAPSLPARRSRRSRNAMAVVELTVALPILFLVIFASIETCNMIFLQQAITEAAYDGAQKAMEPGATEASIVAHVQQILTAQDIVSTTVSVGNGSTPFENVAPGETFSVVVTADTDANLLGAGLFANFQAMDVEVVARKY